MREVVISRVAPGPVPVVGSRVLLPWARLEVQLRQEDGLSFLDVRSQVDPEQGLLLALASAPVCSGLSLFTRLGRLHSLDWALAYGPGTLPADAFVEFTSDRIRYAGRATAPVQAVGGHCWVAEVEGAFDRVALHVGGVEVAQAPLADRW